MTGLLGGFTTFSAFSLDALQPVGAGGTCGLAALYVVRLGRAVAAGGLGGAGTWQGALGMSGVQTIRVGEDEGEQRLDRWLRKTVPAAARRAQSRSCAARASSRVDGGRVKAATRVEAGQEVRVPPLPDARPAAESRPAPGPRLADSDAEMIQAAVIWRTNTSSR